MTDQMRYDALGCTGGMLARTPNLDTLASRGVLFNQAYTNAPLCAPARASLLGGVYPHQCGVWNNSPHTFPTGAKNWVKTLKTLGYRTSVFGKTHYYPYDGSVPDMRKAEGFIRSCGYDDINEIPGPRVSGTLLSHMTNEWLETGLWESVREDIESRYRENQAIARPSPVPFELYPDVYVAEQARNYLASYGQEKPWFCFLSFGGPHEPWDCPDSYASHFAQCEVPLPLPPFLDKNPQRPRGSWDEEKGYPDFSLEDVKAIRRSYAGKVELIDHQIGKVLKILEERDELSRTVIIFTSDHGEMNGDHGRLYKSNFLQSSVHIPLIIQGPGIAPGVSSALVELFDLGPTIVGLAGGSLDYRQEAMPVFHPEEMITGKISGSVETGREYVISQLNHEHMIFDGRWKLAVNTRLEPYMLFDLINDPDEQLNLAGVGNVAEVEGQLRERLLSFIEQHPADGFVFHRADEAGDI